MPIDDPRTPPGEENAPPPLVVNRQPREEENAPPSPPDRVVDGEVAGEGATAEDGGIHGRPPAVEVGHGRAAAVEVGHGRPAAVDVGRRKPLPDAPPLLCIANNEGRKEAGRQQRFGRRARKKDRRRADWRTRAKVGGTEAAAREKERGRARKKEGRRRARNFW